MKANIGIVNVFTLAHQAATNDETQLNSASGLSENFSGKSNLPTYEADPYKVSAQNRALTMIKNGKIGKAINFIQRQINTLSPEKADFLLENIKNELYNRKDQNALSIFKHAFDAKPATYNDQQLHAHHPSPQAA
ncbi:MAG: hypothetical protein KTR28_05525 [Micavibrio sp.]|nr:hypothetical protein [Micavibrio sp.]